jgi:cell division protein FtsB
MEQLVAMMAVVLRSSALKVRGHTTHDQELVSRHISQHRAVDAVQEELELILAKLERIQGKGNSTSHRMSSYHQLFANLLNDIEGIQFHIESNIYGLNEWTASIFNEDRLKLEQIRDEQQIVKQESNKLHKSLTDKLAKRDQLVSALEQENNELSDRNSFLEQQNEILMKSLDKSNHGLMDVHQKANIQ